MFVIGRYSNLSFDGKVKGQCKDNYDSLNMVCGSCANLPIYV